jgi:hypothetical protein
VARSLVVTRRKPRSSLRDGPLTDREIIAEINEDLAGMAPSSYQARVLRAIRDHGRNFKAALEVESVQMALAIQVPVPDVTVYRAWRRQQQRSGLTLSCALQFAPWFEDMWQQWYQQAREGGFLFGYFLPDCSECEERGDVLLHVVEFRGHAYRFEFAERGGPALVAGDCGLTLDREQWDAQFDNEPEPSEKSLEAIENVRRLMAGWARQDWNAARQPERRRPTPEERQANKLAKLRAEAAKLGMDVVPATVEPT